MTDHNPESGPAPWTEEWLQHGLKSTERYQTPADRLAMLAQPGTPLYIGDELVGMTQSTRIEEIKEIENEEK